MDHGQPLIVRYLTWRDFPQIWPLYLSMAIEERGEGPSTDAFHEPEMQALVRNDLERSLLHGDIVCLGVFSGDLLVGAGALRSGNFSGVWREPPAMVLFLYVTPEYRHVATLPLVRAGWRTLKGCKTKYVQAMVGAKNWAMLPRMKRMGFRERSIVYERSV